MFVLMIKNKQQKFSALFIVLLLVFTAGCLHGSSGDNEAGKRVLSADIAWKNLLSTSPEALWEKVAESDFSNHLREMELERQRFRRQGLEFWRRYADDPRRYQWLILTTILEPAYPVNLQEWIENEQWPFPNPYEVDQRARLSWARIYPSLKKAALASPAISGQQKRLFMTVEYRRWLERLRQQRARTGAVPDKSKIFDRIIEFAAMFPEPLPGDKGEKPVAFFVGWHIWPLLRRDDIVRLNANDSRELGNRLQEIDSQFVRNIGLSLTRPETIAFNQKVASGEGFPGKPLSDQFAEFLSQYKTLHKGLWEQLTEKDLMYSALLRELYHYPAIHQPTCQLGSVYFRSDDDIARLKYREMGLRHWDDMLPENRAVWRKFHTTFALLPHYPKGYLNNLFPGGKVGEYQQPENVDQIKTADLDRRTEERVNTLIAEGELSPGWEAVMAGEKILGRLGRAWLGFVQKEQRIENLAALKSSLLSLYPTYKGQPQFDARVETAVGYLIAQAARLGLSMDYLKAVTRPLMGSDNEKLRALADAVRKPESFKIGASIDLQVPTLDGKWFDTANKYKGKILLIDHWATSCAPCIAEFPKIHKLYDDYKYRGFEVASIAYDAQSNRARVDDIKERLGLTWQIYNGEGLWPLMSARYGYTGYPQYMLIDRNGRLVAKTKALRGSALRARVEEMLAAEGYNDNAAPSLWKLSDENTTLYLMGTLHNLKQGSHWQSEKINAVIDKIDILYVELDPNTTAKKTAEVLKEYSIAPKGKTVMELLSGEDKNRLTALMEKLGIPETAFDNQRPWSTLITLEKLYNNQSYVMESGVDTQITAKAREKGVELRWFATIEEQIKGLAFLTSAQEMAWLADFLKRLQDDPNAFDRILTAYLKGDDATVEKEMVTPLRKTFPAVYKALSVDRNRLWTEQMVKVMEKDEGTVLVAVGIGHLVGPDSLQKMLSEKGYTVNRVH